MMVDKQGLRETGGSGIFRKKQYIFCIVLAFFNSSRYNKLVKVSVPALGGRAGTENKRK